MPFHNTLAPYNPLRVIGDSYFNRLVVADLAASPLSCIPVGVWTLASLLVDVLLLHYLTKSRAYVVMTIAFIDGLESLHTSPYSEQTLVEALRVGLASSLS